MNSYKRVVRIPTTEYAYEQIEVVKEFDDKTTDEKAWEKVDQAVEHKLNQIKQELELEREFADQAKKEAMPVTVAQPAPQTPAPPTSQQASMPKTTPCPIHNVPMYGKDGQYGWFYSHKLPDGTWCNGAPKKEKYTI